MEIEYEVKIYPIDKNDVRQRLSDCNAQKVYDEFLQKRFIFSVPGTDTETTYARVRQEYDQVTMSLKVVDSDSIEGQKEISLVVDDFEAGVAFLQSIGFEVKAYQETKRELWRLDGADITLDHWPFLEPFIEVEALDEKTVRHVVEKLGFNYSQARFGSVTPLYYEKYNVSHHVINELTPRITFDMDNPFV